jgi:phosphatidate cytidylyltransferase
LTLAPERVEHLFRRIVTGAVGLVIAVYIINHSGVLLRVALLLIALIGLAEFYKALRINQKPICITGYAAAVVYMSMLDKLDATGIIFGVSLFTLAVLAFLVFKHREISVFDVAITLFGFFYVCFLLSNIYLVREHYLGKYAVWLIVISAWGSDTGAYFTGVFLGRHKLAPELSPKKTIEGAVGGVVCATVLGLIYGLFAYRYFAIDTGLVWLSVIVVFFGSIFSQLGDLAASSIKRNTHVKDFGDVIPGHGGILDRFDSILFTAPTVYCVLIAASNMRLTQGGL